MFRKLSISFGERDGSPANQVTADIATRLYEMLGRLHALGQITGKQWLIMYHGSHISIGAPQQPTQSEDPDPLLGRCSARVGGAEHAGPLLPVCILDAGRIQTCD